MANAEYALPDFSVKVHDAVPKKAIVKLNEKSENVAGVRLPKFEMKEAYDAGKIFYSYRNKFISGQLTQNQRKISGPNFQFFCL
jgi:vacuolar-type H+-ATPase subunit D/Vma8